MERTSLSMAAGLAGDLMKGTVVFRADASLQIGTGHVMRCLTLADALREKGAECLFICRNHQGNLIDMVRSKGFVVHALPMGSLTRREARDVIDGNVRASDGYSEWLGATQREDVDHCTAILSAIRPAWLVVDHYALDAMWELALDPYYDRLMVIDDLANRAHACDLLLDQTYGREPEDYDGKVADDCKLLCGSAYALLRPEFSKMRPLSIKHRATRELRRLLITMGGVDKDNVTGLVLQTLRNCVLPLGLKVSVVLGATAPWSREVELLARDMPFETRVQVGVHDMASLMSDSDLAIGAAGATSWERCCLGLPSIMVVLAENQRAVALGLERKNVARVIHETKDVAVRLPLLMQELVEEPRLLNRLTNVSLQITDGRGLDTVTQLLEA